MSTNDKTSKKDKSQVNDPKKVSNSSTYNLIKKASYYLNQLEIYLEIKK